MLSEEEEKLIADLSKAFSDNETIFSNLTDSDIDFGKIDSYSDSYSRANIEDYTTAISFDSILFILPN
mgnify:CR=1 FL=1